MNIIVSRHVFGSIRGYTTLAKSSDLSPEEISKLEILSFGQTNESSYLDSLQTNPAYISRSLYSEKWAVTRVFKGKPDIHNRTTLLFISAIFSIHDWLYSLKCDVNKLLYNSNLWQWNGEEKLTSIEISVESNKEIPGMDIRNKVLSLLGAVEEYTSDEDTTIVVKESEFDGKILRCLNMVLPVTSKHTFSCTARSLNDGLPLSLISMAKEGSLGNSKRKIVNWTQDSFIENCPYTQSLSEFWQQGKLPPCQFIDSCKSFLIDFGGEPEPKPQKRRLTSKPLSDEIANARIGQKKYLSRKLAVLLFTCAFIAGIATVITVGAIRFNNKKKVRSLIESKIIEAHSFVIENDLKKFFTKDEYNRTEIIKEMRRLQNELEKNKDLPEIAGDVRLKTQLNTGISDLNNWYNLTQTENQRHNVLEGLFRQTIQLKLKVPPYPTRETILRVGTLEKNIKANIEKAKYLAQNDRLRQNDFEKRVLTWHDNMMKFLLDEKQLKVTENTKWDILTKPPKNYSIKQYEEYNSLKRELNDYREDESLKNAKDSPIDNHRIIAFAMINELDKAIDDCNSIFQDMDSYKKDAETSFNNANDKLSDPNITDCTVATISKLVQARSHLDKARERWPKMPNLDGLNRKFANNLKEIIRKSEDQIKDNPNVDVPAKPNLRKKELQEILKKAKTISEEIDFPKIDELLKLLEKDSKLNAEQQQKNQVE